MLFLIFYLFTMIMCLPLAVQSFRRSRICSRISFLCSKAIEKDFVVDRVCADNNFPTYSTLKTRSAVTMPPYIIHIKALRDFDNIEQLLTRATGLSLGYLKELLQFGAIYMSTSIPGKYYHKRGKEVLVDMTKAKRLEVSHDNDIIKVTKDSYFRVHVNPRRNYIANIDFQACVVTVLNNVIYINKPSGIPVVPGVDNKIENLEYQISQLDTNLYKQLYALGRLDSCTSGSIHSYSLTNTYATYSFVV